MGEVHKSIVDNWLTEDNLFLLTCWSRDGLTLETIAERIGVSEQTLWKWRKKYEIMDKALSVGREIIDYQVENALLKSALGYKTTETKTVINGQPDKDGNRTVRVEKTEKEYPPNVTAIAIWLNNRKPEQWKRNRDNVLELKEEDSNITVNIIQHAPRTDDSEWKVDTQKGKKVEAIKSEEATTQDLDEWPDDWEE